MKIVEIERDYRNHPTVPNQLKSDPPGVKYDSGKPMYGLLPPIVLKGVVEVLTLGAEKYSPGNWMRVPNAQARYLHATMRHLESWRMGESSDDETGKNHLSHAICCLMFLAERDIVGEQEWEEYQKNHMTKIGG